MHHVTSVLLVISLGTPYALEETCEASKGRSLLQFGNKGNWEGAEAIAGLHPLAWFHIPKCGQSFGNTLVHYANASLSEDIFMKASGESKQMMKFSKQLAESGQLDFNYLFWKGLHFSTHNAIDEAAWSTWQGKFMGMFRPPASRLLSAYSNFGSNRTPEDYFIEARAVTAQMLSGQKDGLPKNPSSDLQVNVDLAKSRLKGFAFIGLTLEWDLSICLFHAMFGGACKELEFMNMHPTDYSSHPANPFDDFEDTEDEAVFAEANNTFWTNMRKYNVTRWSCEHRFCKDFRIPFQLTPALPEMPGVSLYTYDWPGRWQLDRSML